MAGIGPGHLSRRDLVKAGAAVGAAAAIGGRGSAEAQDLPEVPRNRELILCGGGNGGEYGDYELWNGYAAGANHGSGLGLLYEPLAYYSPLTDMYTLWLSEGWEYNADSTGLRILIRAGVTWSDGEPFGAEDVAFTINALRDTGSNVALRELVAPYVEEAVANGDGEVLVQFTSPTPRFMFTALYSCGNGLYVLPKHVFEGENLASFGHFDLDGGLPVTTGPWKVVASSAERKVLDRRERWWAAEQGLAPELPAVERIVFLPFTSEDDVAQKVIDDEIDATVDLRPATIERILQANPKVTTFTGTRAPFGNVDWSPISLYLNCEREPFAAPELRWALSSLIDRQALVDRALGGAGSISALPTPAYPAFQPYDAAIADLLERYPTAAFDPDKGAELLTNAGWAKTDGTWQKDGQTLDLAIEGTDSMAEIGAAVAEQLSQQGVNASFSSPADLAERQASGAYAAVLSGHEGSLNNDPYFTAALYQSRSEAAPGRILPNVARWHDDAYDGLVDEMALTPIDHEPQADPEKLAELWQAAMAIWLPALPDIQLLERHHRIPMNQTYWRGWPSSSNAYVNSAFWYLTFQLVLNELSAVQ